MNKSTEKAIQFVTLWNQAETLEEIATELGITKSSATTRGTQYRKRGVNLKKFTGGNSGPHVDWDAVLETTTETATE